MRLTTSRVVFLIVLLAAGIGLLGRAAASWLGPVSSPHLADEAREYLHAQNIKPLSGPLTKLLADPNRVRTQFYRFLDKPCPDFELKDVHGKPWKLSREVKDGPVVLVFYYGYHCNHCVSQLFQLNDDLRYFQELGAQVVAVSADPPELTQERFKQYGPFKFPVLADPNFRVARMYEVFEPAQGDKEPVLLHGTFIIDRDRMVQWANRDFQPFSSDRTLLYLIAKLEGRLPDK